MCDAQWMQKGSRETEHGIRGMGKRWGAWDGGGWRMEVQIEVRTEREDGTGGWKMEVDDGGGGWMEHGGGG